jgi:hypothetical protein
MTLFAVHGEEVHVLLTHEGTDHLSIGDAQNLVLKERIALSQEDTTLLRMDEWVLYRCRSRNIMVIHVGGPLIVQDSDNDWLITTDIAERELRHHLLYEMIRPLKKGNALRKNVELFLEKNRD